MMGIIATVVVLVVLVGYTMLWFMIGDKLVSEFPGEELFYGGGCFLIWFFSMQWIVEILEKIF